MICVQLLAMQNVGALGKVPAFFVFLFCVAVAL